MKIFVENDNKLKTSNVQLNEVASKKRISDFDKILNSEIINI